MRGQRQQGRKLSFASFTLLENLGKTEYCYGFKKGLPILGTKESDSSLLSKELIAGDAVSL